MRKTGDVDVYWYVFDRWDHPAGFTDRFKMVVSVAHPRIRVVPHTLINTQEELDLYESLRLAEGFEGVMIRDPQGPYKQGRSTEREGWLLKVKRFLDSEAEIIGFEEEMHNTNPAETSETGHMKRSSRQEGLVGKNTLGALKVRDIKSGVEFSIGTGFTAAYRAIYWDQREKLLGEIVSYKYQPTGVKDRPRFPVFKGFRHKDDL
jgi:DNA ligase-1